MRLSVDPLDLGYHPQANRCRVFLEGAERSNVVTADEERRYAVTYRLDDQGKTVLRAGKPVKDEFWGAVRIELPEGGLQPWPPVDCCP